MPVRETQVQKLLIRALADGRYSAARLATELVESERTLGCYLAGSLPMPIETQICFAHVLINQIPGMEREGRNLLSRLRSQISFQSGETVTHSHRPAGFF